MELTERQREAWEQTQRLFDEMPISPTIREIGEALGVPHSVAAYYVGVFIELGLLGRIPKVARGLWIIRDDQ